MGYSGQVVCSFGIVTLYVGNRRVGVMMSCKTTFKGVHHGSSLRSVR